MVLGSLAQAVFFPKRASIRTNIFGLIVFRFRKIWVLYLQPTPTTPSLPTNSGSVTSDGPTEKYFPRGASSPRVLKMCGAAIDCFHCNADWPNKDAAGSLPRGPFILCRDWKRVSRKGAKAQSSDSITSFASKPLSSRCWWRLFSIADSMWPVVSFDDPWKVVCRSLPNDRYPTPPPNQGRVYEVAQSIQPVQSLPIA